MIDRSFHRFQLCSSSIEEICKERAPRQSKKSVKREKVSSFTFVQSKIIVLVLNCFSLPRERERERERVRESERVSISRNTIKRGDRPIRER